VLDSDNELVDHKVNWMLPGYAQIWIRLTAGPVTVALRSRRYDPVQPTIMYGCTSRAMPVSAQGGCTVAIDVSPLGWSRFIKGNAIDFCDRIVPLADLMPADFVDNLTAALRNSDKDLAVKGIIDDALLRNIPPPGRQEESLVRMMGAFADPGITDLSAAAERTGLPTATMQRLSRHYFGFNPKLSLMRSRFLTAIVNMLLEDGPIDNGVTPPGYHNVPHFLRDAQRFLGMTPRRFCAMDMPYLRSALRARRLVLAAPTPSLDRM
jgi:AraC-like DNA-binding protein